MRKIPSAFVDFELGEENKPVKDSEGSVAADLL